MPARCSPNVKGIGPEALFDASNFSDALFRGGQSSVAVTEPAHPSSDPDIDNLKFVAYGIIGCVVIALGILGNVINLAVLTQPSLKGVTFIYLTWLATSDLMTLLVSITSMMRLHGVQPRSYAAAIYFAYVELPLVNAFMASSVFLVVALTVDRYFSVCLPTRFKEVHNMRRCRNSIVCAYAVAFALYVPICFQKSPVEVVNNANDTEYIACEEVSVVTHPVFKIYLLFKEVVVRIGPVVVLAILNTTIIITFRKTLKKRQNMLGQNATNATAPNSSPSNKKFREERRLLALLGGIVIMFFLCMTPAAALTILNSDDKESDFSFQVFRATANCLELANYSMNFYVYCMCSPDFRRTFVGLFKCCRKAAEEVKGRRLSTGAGTSVIRADANSITAVAGSSIECSTNL